MQGGQRGGREGRGDQGDGRAVRHALTSEKRTTGVDGDRWVVESALAHCVPHRRAFLQAICL